MKNILLFCLGLLFSGCLGIGFVHQEKLVQTTCEGTSLKSYLKSSKDFNTSFEFVETDNNISMYKRKTSDYDLKGIIPMVGIGIPLVIPFGYNYEYFYFKDGYCFKEVVENSTWTGAMCGLLNENGKMGCDTLK